MNRAVEAPHGRNLKQLSDRADWNCAFGLRLELVGQPAGTRPDQQSERCVKVRTGLAPIYRTVMGLGADGADGWEASKATGLR